MKKASLTSTTNCKAGKGRKPLEWVLSEPRVQAEEAFAGSYESLSGNFTGTRSY